MVPGDYCDQGKLKPNASRSMTPSCRKNKMLIESLGLGEALERPATGDHPFPSQGWIPDSIEG
jgi:hypothetical protein